jgi:hypothetical protein
MKIGLYQTILLEECCTCFPVTESFLNDSDNQFALMIMARNKNVDNYRSTMDFFASETMPYVIKPACFAYYDDLEQGKIIENFDSDMIDFMDQILLKTAKHAKEIHDSERRLPWTKLIKSTITQVVRDPFLAYCGPVDPLNLIAA